MLNVKILVNMYVDKLFNLIQYAIYLDSSKPMDRPTLEHLDLCGLTARLTFMYEETRRSKIFQTPPQPQQPQFQLGFEIFVFFDKLGL